MEKIYVKSYVRPNHNPDYFSRLPRSFSGPSHPNNQGFVVSEICFTYKI